MRWCWQASSSPRGKASRRLDLAISAASGGADLGEEAIDGVAQHARLIVKLAGAGQHLGGRRAGGFRCRSDTADMRVDLVRARCDRLDVARNFPRRIALLFDRG